MSSIIKTVVQQTSKTTPVRADYKNCIIQTVPLTDAGNTVFEFVVNNKEFYPEQNIQLTAVYGGLGVPFVTLVSQARGTFTIRVANIGSAALNAALLINTSVIN
jgi:hypothetical protein